MLIHTSRGRGGGGEQQLLTEDDLDRSGHVVPSMMARSLVMSRDKNMVGGEGSGNGESGEREKRMLLYTFALVRIFSTLKT
jgi:hypothetical protein